VIDGADPSEQAAAQLSTEELAGAVEAVVAAGASRRDAVRDVAGRLGIARSVVYEAAIRSAASPRGEALDR
jgi:hypothetical protein